MQQFQSRYRKKNPNQRLEGNNGVFSLAVDICAVLSSQLKKASVAPGVITDG
jgi:hypothetical protein